MILLCALLLAPCCDYGTGSSAVERSPARPPLGGRETLPLAASESLCFLGLEGQLSGDAELAMRERLEREFSLHVLGTPLRALSERNRQVWAVRVADPAGTVEALKRPLKKDGYNVTLLNATAVSLLGEPPAGEVQRGLREFERGEKKVWVSHRAGRGSLVWVFHESTYGSKKVLEGLRGQNVKAGFHHQELELAAAESTDLGALAEQAGAKLDLARSTSRDGALILDLYVRDVPRFLALERGKKIVPCPDVLSFLETVPAGKLSWNVTFEQGGFPFEG